MKVFKTYFKILNKYKGMFFMYIGIFVGLMFVYVTVGVDSQEDYMDSTCKVAVIDEEHSIYSEKLYDYIVKGHELVEIESDQEEQLLSYFYHQQIDVLVRIKDGYEESAKEGKFRKYLEVVAVSRSGKLPLFESYLTEYLNTLEMYQQNGMSGELLFSKIEQAMQQEIEVEFTAKTSTKTKDSFYFTYIAYVLLAGIISSICPVLIVFKKEQIQKRIRCSSYSFQQYYRELVSATMLSGMVFCLAFLLAAIVMIPEIIFSQKGVFYCLNMFSYGMLSLAICFLLSVCLKGSSSVSMCSNIIALGMSFLCGIFVPAELLSDQVLFIAKFLPAYWYAQNVTMIQQGMQEVGLVWKYMGIQLLYAVVFLLLGVAREKGKRMV